MYKKDRLFWVPLLLTLLAAAMVTGAALAQGEDAPPIHLSMSRDWGYGGLNGRIQGLFSLKVKDADGLVRVTFYMDDTVLFVDEEAPFRFQYRTDDYPPGAHTLWAQAETADGRVLESNRIQVFYLTKEEANAETGKLLWPILGITALAVLGSAVLPLLLGRGKKPGQPGQNYGFFGGAICPHCGKPYAMHFYGLNLLTHRFDRCPYCGRWALVRRQPLEVLREAEARLAAESSVTAPELSEEEKLRQLLDESRYEE